MANAINYAKTYSETLDAAWPYVLHFGALYATPNNGRFRFKGGKTIEIPNITTTGRINAVRDGDFALTRNFENTWETKELTNQRQWSTLIHPDDIDKTNMALTISNITATFNNEHKFPEMDAYCISKLYADWTALGRLADETALSDTNFLEAFDRLMQQMTENNVPLTGRYLYVTPAVMSMMKQVATAHRIVNTTTEINSLSRTITTIDGVPVIEVPSSLMKTSFVFDEGFAPAEDAKQIHMMLVHPESVITPISYQFAQLDEPSAMTGGKYVYFEESYEDVFLLKNRHHGLNFIVEA